MNLSMKTVLNCKSMALLSTTISGEFILVHQAQSQGCTKQHEISSIFISITLEGSFSFKKCQNISFVCRRIWAIWNVHAKSVNAEDAQWIFRDCLLKTPAFTVDRDAPKHPCSNGIPMILHCCREPYILRGICLLYWIALLCLLAQAVCSHKSLPVV